MNDMTITSAQYMTHYTSDEPSSIEATIDGVTMHVPLEVGNRHYNEIMRQVEAGTLTIADAD